MRVEGKQSSLSVIKLKDAHDAKSHTNYYLLRSLKLH
jgi:hypothetical protein